MQISQPLFASRVQSLKIVFFPNRVQKTTHKLISFISSSDVSYKCNLLQKKK